MRELFSFQLLLQDYRFHLLAPPRATLRISPPFPGGEGRARETAAGNHGNGRCQPQEDHPQVQSQVRVGVAAVALYAHRIADANKPVHTLIVRGRPLPALVVLLYPSWSLNCPPSLVRGVELS